MVRSVDKNRPHLTIRLLDIHVETKKISRYRFLDIQYNRNENFRTVLRSIQHQMSVESGQSTATDANSSDAAKNGDEKHPEQQQLPTISLNDDRHVENTVIFLPNVWSLVPTSADYEKIVAAYREFIDNPLASLNATPAAAKEADQQQTTQKSASNSSNGGDTAANVNSSGVSGTAEASQKSDPIIESAVELAPTAKNAAAKNIESSPTKKATTTAESAATSNEEKSADVKAENESFSESLKALLY